MELRENRPPLRRPERHWPQNRLPLRRVRSKETRWPFKDPPPLRMVRRHIAPRIDWQVLSPLRTPSRQTPRVGESANFKPGWRTGAAQQVLIFLGFTSRLPRVRTPPPGVRRPVSPARFGQHQANLAPLVPSWDGEKKGGWMKKPPARA